MADLSKFYSEEVEPLLFSKIGEMFSDFVYNERRAQWESPYKLNGIDEASEPRNDKTIIANPINKTYIHIRALEQGGESLDLLELIERRKHLSFTSAVKYASDIAGVIYPEDANYNSAKQKEKKEKQELLAFRLNGMKKALFSPEGEKVLNYLKNVRGYSEEYIKEQPFGFIDAHQKGFKGLKTLLSYTDNRGVNHKPYTFIQEDGTGIGVGYTHQFATAFISDGEIKGFIFRTIMSDKEILSFKNKHNLEKFSKYYMSNISAWDTQAFYPFALPVCRFNSYFESFTNVTIVEGVLDALRGNYAGIPNIVGVSQSSITKQQLEKLKAKGAKEITLLMDTEAKLKEDGTSNEESIKDNEKRVAKAVELIHSQGLSSYVCYLPSPDGKKVDVDSYFKGLDGDALRIKAQELRKLIENAQGGYTFLYRRLEKAYNETSQTYRNKKKFLYDTIILTNGMNEEIDLPEKKTILKLYSEATGIAITQQDIDEAKNAKVVEEPSEKELIELRDEYRRVETLEQKEQRRMGKQKGLCLDYTFYSKNTNEQEQLMLPSGALTYVCLPSSHGKTRLIENMALQLTMDEKEDGAVLFFSVEEDADAIEDEFLSLYYTLQHTGVSSIKSKKDFLDKCANCRLSKNHLRTIRSFYSEEDAQKKDTYFEGKTGDTFHDRLFKDFDSCRREFHAKYIETERLKIYYEKTRNVDKIIKAVRFLSTDLMEENLSKKAIKAVFIDYIQRLKKKGDFRGNRKEELTAVTNDLMSLSIELQVPIVLAVQLNREALSPLEMDMQNIADASEIELSGNTIILGWSSSFNARVKSTFYYKDKDKKRETEEATAFRERTGIVLGDKGDLYLFIAKNRAGLREVESRLYFDGNSGLIVQGKRAKEINLGIPSFKDGKTISSSGNNSSGSSTLDKYYKEHQHKPEAKKTDEAQHKPEEEAPPIPFPEDGNSKLKETSEALPNEEALNRMKETIRMQKEYLKYDSPEDDGDL